MSTNTNTTNTITPLPDEPAMPGVVMATAKPPNRIKKVIALGVMFFSILGVVGTVSYRHFFPGNQKEVVHDLATDDMRRLRMPASGASAPMLVASAPRANGIVVPNIDPGSSSAQAIPLRGSPGASTSPDGSTASGPKPVSPEDAPMFAGGQVGTNFPGMQGGGAYAGAPGAAGSRPQMPEEIREQLDAQRKRADRLISQIQDGIKTPAGLMNVPGSGPAGGQSQASTGALFGSMEKSVTPTAVARSYGDRNLTIPKGTLFTCSLKTKVITATSGLVGCQVVRNVYSDDGKVLLIERGSHLDGEYRVVSVRPGLTRIPVLWTRVRTVTGVTVELDSPATGALGEGGLGGYVDNRWPERIGAALLLSLVDDALKYAANSATEGGSTLVLGNTQSQGSKMAEKVLEATINIPPILYQNQGSVVGVYVARDLDFSSVYELRPQ